MKFLQVLFFVTFSSFISLYAQRNANNWYFGNRAGISFATNIPVAVDDNAMDAIGATASVSHPVTGALLFYSNGERVWNAHHEIMLNGDELQGSLNSTNTAYAIPDPGDTARYYLFTIKTDPLVNETEPRRATIYYSLIDMRIDQGRGGIVEEHKNILLEDSVTEKIAAIPHEDQQGVWLLLHQINNNRFSVYRVTASGVSFSHEQAIGTPHIYNLTELQGHMKASPDNKKLAVTLRSYDPARGPVPGPFEVYDFDNSTGMLSNPQNLGEYTLQYGVSFSPGSRLLYLHGFAETGRDAGDLMYQFDLADDDPVSSRTGLLRSIFPNRANLANFNLQIGPDGRIYGAGNLSESTDFTGNRLLVINRPDRLGVDTEVSLLTLNWPETRVGIDLPNFIQSTFEGLSPGDNPNAPCNDEIGIDLYPNPAENYITLEVAERCFSAYTLTFYNTIGQRMGEHFVDQQEFGPIDVQSFKRGLYFAVLEFADGRIVKRFVKL